MAGEKIKMENGTLKVPTNPITAEGVP